MSHNVAPLGLKPPISEMIAVRQGTVNKQFKIKGARLY